MTTNRYSIRLAALGIATLLLGACATPIKSTIDQASDSDFSEFATYAWVSEEPYMSRDVPTELVNPLNFQRVRSSIEAELERKGYRKAAASEADFVLGFTLGSRDRVRVQSYYDTFGYNYYGSPFGFSRFGRFNRFGNGFGINQTVRTITEGTLAVDLFDNRSREAIWHGMATKSLTGDPRGEELIAEAVAALIGPLPDRMLASANAPADDNEPLAVM